MSERYMNKRSSAPALLAALSKCKEETRLEINGEGEREGNVKEGIWRGTTNTKGLSKSHMDIYNWTMCREPETWEHLVLNGISSLDPSPQNSGIFYMEEEAEGRNGQR